jgi:hypothetical protein
VNIGSSTFLLTNALFVQMPTLVEEYSKSIGVWIGICIQAATIVGIMLLFRPRIIAHHVLLWLSLALLGGVAASLVLAFLWDVSQKVVLSIAAAGGLVATLVLPSSAILATWSEARSENLSHTTSVSVGMAVAGIICIALSFAFSSFEHFMFVIAGAYFLALLSLSTFIYRYHFGGSAEEDHGSNYSILSPPSSVEGEGADPLERMQTNGRRFNLAIQFLTTVLVYVAVPGLLPLLNIEGDDLRLSIAAFLIGNVLGRLLSYIRVYLNILVAVSLQIFTFLMFFLLVRLTDNAWAFAADVLLFSMLNGILSTQLLMITNRVKCAIATKLGSVVGAGCGLLVLYLTTGKLA